MLQRPLMVRWVVGSIPHGGPSSQCSTTGVTVCGMVHIKQPLLLIGKSSPWRCDSGLPPSLSEWFFTICPTSYNRKEYVRHYIKHI